MLTAVASGDKLEISLNLKQYKFPNGGVNYDVILRVPLEDRLPGLITKVGLKQVHMALAAAITMTMESLNLAKPLTPNQIIDLVDILIDTSSEDYLSLEDIMLFLQQLVRGGSGTLFSSMDIPKFMQSFEKYRQQRHDEYHRLKESQDAQFKCSSNTPRVRPEMEKDKNIDPRTFFELMQTYNEGRSENME
jgi:hypothetical protein